MPGCALAPGGSYHSRWLEARRATAALRGGGERRVDGAAENGNRDPETRLARRDRRGRICTPGPQAGEGQGPQSTDFRRYVTLRKLIASGSPFEPQIGFS